MNQLFVSIFLLFTLITSLQVEAEKLKVGLISGFSGAWASYGEAYQQGLKLADVSKQIEFLYEDDQFTASKTIAAYHKLVQEDKVQAILVGDTVTATAIAPLALKYQVPTLVWANAEPVFVDNPYIFRLWPTPKAEFSKISEILNSQISESLQIIVYSHSYSSMWGKEILQRYTNTENKFLEEIPDSLKDYKPLILNAKSKKIKAFAICLNPGEHGLFINQMQQLNYQAQIFACNFIETKADFAAIKDYPHTISFFATDLRQSFLEAYTTVCPDRNHLVSAAIMYDAAKILELAQLDQTHEPLVKRIAKIHKFRGAHTSSELRNTAGDQYLNIPFSLYKIHQGRLTKSDS